MCLLTRKFIHLVYFCYQENLILLANGPLPLLHAVLAECCTGKYTGNTDGGYQGQHTHFPRPSFALFHCSTIVPIFFPSLSLSYLGKHSWQLYNTRLTSGTGLKSTLLSDFVGQSISNRNGPPNTKRTQSSLLSLPSPVPQTSYHSTMPA